MSHSFIVHDVSWNEERLQRFWAFFSESVQADRAYFSSHSGHAIIQFASRYMRLDRGTKVLDYGCGPGFLLERLLASGIRAEGLEFSTATLQRAADRCGRYPQFGGITRADQLPSPIPADSFDVVFLIEVIEHLLPEQVDATIEDIVRILRPGGHLVLTTPHNEDIVTSRTICPDCGCVFHPWQHVGSHTVRSLTALLDQHRLAVRICRATTLGGTRLGGTIRAARKALERLIGNGSFRAAQPHLVSVARKQV